MWLVAQTESQREQVAAKWLKEQRFEVYLPCIGMKSIMHQRVVERLVPLFPSYVFVSAVRCWQPIVRTIGVMDVLFSGDHPAQLSDEIIGRIRAQERDGVVQLPSSRLRRGDRLYISAGLFQHRFAIYEDMRPHQRIAVLLSLFGSTRLLELPRSHVRRV